MTEASGLGQKKTRSRPILRLAEFTPLKAGLAQDVGTTWIEVGDQAGLSVQEQGFFTACVRFPVPKEWLRQRSAGLLWRVLQTTNGGEGMPFPCRAWERGMNSEAQT